jgi:hypothetical protein
MAVHYLRGFGVLATLFGIGHVQTLCGSEVHAGSGPVDDACNCRECLSIANGGPDRERPPLI